MTHKNQVLMRLFLSPAHDLRITVGKDTSADYNNDWFFFVYPMRLIFACFLILHCIVTFTIQAQEADEVAINQQLETIKSRLSELKTALNTAQGEEAQLLQELERQDQKINDQGQLIRSTQQKIDLSTQQLKGLEQQITQLKQSIKKQKQQMASLLRLHIYISHDRFIKKILLNRDSRSVDITQHQIKFLQHRLYSLIEDIAVQITQLSDIKTETETKRQQLQQQQNALQAAQDQLIAQKQQRAQVLSRLRQTIRAYRSESESLNQDRQRLNQLLAELNQLLDDLPDDLGENAHFAKLKGQLNKPLNGDIIRRFGTLRAGNSRWDGIVVAGQSGQSVSASAYGRVAFADWLRGYGLLVVIDHGDHYMSLYGHNQSLLVEVGDWVQAGQEIATAGQSGNLSQSGVYFEIRKQAKPENPTPWLKSG